MGILFEGCNGMDQKSTKLCGSFWEWIGRFSIYRLKVFHQLTVIITIMIIFFIIQGITGVYINDRMMKSSLDMVKISSKRFNNVSMIKTYVELIEKEYIKVLTQRGNIQYLINEADIQGLPRIGTEMVPAVRALREVAPEECDQILTNITAIEALIRLPVSEENLAALKRELYSISISIDTATSKSINASYDAVTRSSDFSTASKLITVIISLIAIGTISFIYIFMLSRTITEPIQKLAAYAMEIAKGKFPVEELEIKSSADLNILALAFNKMAASIQKMIAELTEKSKLERKLHEEELKNLKISQQLNEARFLALQSQINPHFLFNTLNTIMRKSMFEKAPATTKLIQSLSEIFRYNLQNPKKEVLLAEELEMVKKYVHIQQTRFGARVGFEIVCRDVEGVEIPRFIIQPLVENAIIHGIEPKVKGGSVRIKTYQKRDVIYLKIIDNGVGMGKRQIKAILNGTEASRIKGHTTAIGINNVRDRLLLYYKNPTCFSLKSKPNLGTVITLKLSRNFEGACDV